MTMGETLPPQQGTLHSYAYNLTAFEFGARSTDKAVVFIGGLGNKYLSVPYLERLNKALDPDWKLFQIDIYSSGIGWGTGSLDRDADEIEKLVEYLKKSCNISKVVLFGHSTGCQDSFHYILENKKDVDAIVCQAPVSDREALVRFFEESGKVSELEEYNNEAREIYKQEPLQVLPKKFSDILFDAPINAYRWLSLAASDGDDDYFSTDLSDEKLKSTFGRLNKPGLFLISGEDPIMKESVDKQSIIDRWANFSDAQYFKGAIIEGATHDVGPESKDEEKAVTQLLSKVKEFLSTI